jgi:hypothetical protein
MRINYAISSRRHWRSMAWLMALTGILVFSAIYLPRWGRDVILRVDAVSQQRKCEEFWGRAQGSVRISEAQSRRTTEFSSANTPECVRRFEEIVGSSMSYPIVFLGRIRVTSTEEVMVVARLYVWHIRDVVFSLRFDIKTYSIATRMALPAEVKRYDKSVDLYPHNPLDAPSFKAGYRDPNDDTSFTIPCRFNGVDLPIEFKILPDKTFRVKLPPGWPGSAQCAGSNLSRQ